MVGPSATATIEFDQARFARLWCNYNSFNKVHYHPTANLQLGAAAMSKLMALVKVPVVGGASAAVANSWVRQEFVDQGVCRLLSAFWLASVVSALRGDERERGGFIEVHATSDLYRTFEQSLTVGCPHPEKRLDLRSWYFGRSRRLPVVAVPPLLNCRAVPP